MAEKLREVVEWVVAEEVEGPLSESLPNLEGRDRHGDRQWTAAAISLSNCLKRSICSAEGMLLLWILSITNMKLLFYPWANWMSGITLLSMIILFHKYFVKKERPTFKCGVCLRWMLAPPPDGTLVCKSLPERGRPPWSRRLSWVGLAVMRCRNCGRLSGHRTEGLPQETSNGRWIFTTCWKC